MHKTSPNRNAGTPPRVDDPLDGPFHLMARQFLPAVVTVQYVTLPVIQVVIYLILEPLASECLIPSGGALIGEHLQGFKADKAVSVFTRAQGWFRGSVRCAEDEGNYPKHKLRSITEKTQGHLVTTLHFVLPFRSAHVGVVVLLCPICDGLQRSAGH